MQRSGFIRRSQACLLPVSRFAGLSSTWRFHITSTRWTVSASIWLAIPISMAVGRRSGQTQVRLCTHSRAGMMWELSLKRVQSGRRSER